MSSDALKVWAQKPSQAAGISLQDHLTGVVMHILEKQPEDPIAALAQISAQVKEANLHFRHGNEIILADTEQQQAVTELFKPETVEVDRNGKLVHPVEKPDFYIPDMSAEAELLEWAGLGLSREVSFQLCLSIRRLAKEQKALQNFRFFGKILGSKGDYFVAEGEARKRDAPQHTDKKPWDPIRRDVEKMIHHNKFKYFVCSHPGAPWKQLPNVTYSQVVAAANIRKYMTGNLDAKIETYPPFPGNESNYLRAQIARLASATCLSPDGYYEMREADDETGVENAIIRAAEYAAPDDTSALAELSAWKRYYPAIPEADVLPEVPEPEGDDEPEEPEPPEPTALDIRDMEEEPSHISSMTSSRYSSFCPAVLRSVHWPGAHTVARGGTFCNVYVGSGHPRLNTAFVLLAPPLIHPDVEEKDEVVDLKEQLNLKEDEPPPPEEQPAEEE